MPKIHSLYDRPPSPFYGDFGESETQQHFAADADINNIMAKYAQTGYLVDPFKAPVGSPQFGDFTGVTDFLSAQNAILNAQAAFADLPASVRKFFDNDPASLIAFLDDDSNYDKALEMGLIVPPAKEPDVSSATVVGGTEPPEGGEGNG